MADRLILERLGGSFDLWDGELAPPAGETLRERERERLWVLWGGLRERRGERDGERPRERDREREELSERERLLDLGGKEGKESIRVTKYGYKTSKTHVVLVDLFNINATCMRKG